MGTTISFRTEETKRDELDRLAEALDRDRSWIINQALDNYLDLQQWQIEEIRKGMAATDAGHTVSTAQLREMLEKRNAKVRARRGSADGKRRATRT
ncbi:MAG: ribbon-helix-helix protein, CopG family [Acidobacteriaceae bacterium]|nr:ribbon-helix-helix protein, CopG family [Acidobacteriaceae bacterium]